MNKQLPPLFYRLFLFAFAFVSIHAYSQQATVYSTDFATSAGSGYTTVTGAIGTNTTWNMLRSGTDMGARITGGMLQLTNDATSTGNASGWVLAYTLSQQSSPYSSTLSQNPGLVTWTFNMRQSRNNPSGLGNNNYGNAFILAGTTNTSATTGSGYAVILGNNGNTDPVKLVRYANGIRNTANEIVVSNTSGVNDFGHHYISVKVTYAPGSNTWQLFVRKDSASSFYNPATGYIALQGTGTDGTSTATAMPLIGGFWNASTKKGQTAYFDNIEVTTATPVLTSISPNSKVAGAAAFTLTVTGQNFISGSSVIKWNGVNLTTTYVSATQLTASVPAANVATAGTASITVGTGAATSNPQSFYIDAPGIPSIATSTNALTNFLTVTGTASAPKSFTSSGTSLQNGSITITAPTYFEVSNAQNGSYSSSINVGAATVTTWVRVAASAPAGIYAAPVLLVSSGATTRQINLTGTVLNLEPTTTATSLTFTGINSIQGTINWSGGNGGNHLVVVKPVSAISATLADGVSYYASNILGNGAVVGTDAFVVYAGSANSVSIEGLTPATTYYVSVYEYNGSGGTENYRLTPVNGSFTTLNAPLGLQIKTANTVYTVDFDNTVEGANTGAYAGAGLSEFPEGGDLNSNGFVLSPLTSSGVTFGGEILDDDMAYGNGTSDGGETDGGFYAFQVGTNNYALGVQPDATYPSGSITLKMQNQTGAAVTSLNFGYKIYVRNDEAGANNFNFSYSSDNNTYTSPSVLNETTVAVADALPGWKVYYKVITIANINITAGNYYYIRWSGTTASGSVYDEIALDDITVVANPTSNFAPLAGNVQTAVLAGNSNLSGATTVAGGITFNGGKVNIGANALTLNGTVTNTSTGGLSGTTSSNLAIAGALSPTLIFDAAGNTLNNFSINTTAANTVTLGSNVVVNGALTVDVNQTLALAANTLTGTLGTITNDGTITTTNTTTTPFASGKTWGGTGTLIFSAASTAQYLPSGTYNKVTVNTTGGVTATGNVTFNGNLHLPNANVSAIKGAFDTSTFTATMGPNASNTGVGDVTGIITRSVIAANVEYTFGHPQTAILFPNVGTLPTTLSMKTVLGSAPAAKSNAILRTYDFIQSGANATSPTKALIRAHYLDSELNGNTESKLVDWAIILPSQVLEQSRTNYNTTANYVELANVAVDFFPTSFGLKQLTLADSQAQTVTWNGSVSNVWLHAANWTPAAVPSSTTKVIIPNGATTNFDPELTSSTPAIGTISIEAGGIVNAPAGSNLTVSGATGAWINYGTFNAASGSTVTFNASATSLGDATIAGNTTFNNLVVPSGTTLRALTDNILNISGTFTKNGSFIAGGVENTVIYSGTGQNIVVPNGGGTQYHNLIISGANAVVPASLNLAGDLTTNASVNFTGTTVTFNGNDNENQYVKGTVAPVFDNVTVNKTDTTHTLILQTNATVGGTLTLTSGRLDIASYDLTLGTNPVAGTFSVTTMIDADGTGRVRRPYTGIGSYTFPIGETTSNTTYSPVTVNVTSGSFNNAYVSVNVTDATHPNNYGTSSYLTRYWSVMQTGITGAVATITGTYVLGDAVGGESVLSAAQLNGTFNVVSNPWTKYGLLSSTTLTVTNATLTAGQISYFTGVTAAGITVDVTGEGTFCQNSYLQLSSDVLGGVGGYTYLWSNGLGTAATATPSTTATGSTTYTLTVRDANGATGSDSATVVVTAQPVAGTLSANQVICANTTPSDITLTGYTGTIVRWERSTTTAFTNPAFIYSSNATLTGAEIGNTLTSTRYLRAVVQNGSCDLVYSNYVEVKINTTTWNGTAWDNGTPTITDAVVFTGNYTAAASFSACTIVVNNNAQVVIPTGYTATVNGAVTVTSGTFTVENNAALVQLTNAVNSGNVIVKRNSNPLYRLDYTMWSSPVAGQNLFGFSPETATNPMRFYTYTYNGTQEQYSAVTDPSAISFETGRGYLIRMPNTNALPGYNQGTATMEYPGIFTGVPNNGNIGTPVAVANGIDQSAHYTGVGNPYPSPISVADFFAQNSAVLQAGNGIYFWRKKNDSDATSYAHLTLAGFTVNDAAGGDMAAPGGAFYYNGNNQSSTSFNANWIISPGQGFLVKLKSGLASDATVNFTNAMRRSAPATGGQPFFKTMNSNNEAEVSRWWINLTGANNAFGQALVGYMPQGTQGIDYGYDAVLLANGPNRLYSKVDESNFAIQARPSFVNTDVVPMGFRVAAAGTFTLSLHQLDGVFAQDQDIYIKDNFLGTVSNLKEADYSFTTDAGTFDTRFEVIYEPEGQLGTENPELNNMVMVYKDNTTIHITTGTAEMKNVTIYDIRGSKLYEQTGIANTQTAITNLNVAQQVLIIEIDTVKGKVTKRIIY